MLINFTNHPSANWSDKQITAAKEYGEVFDIPFPKVEPHSDEDYIEKLADDCVTQILAYKPTAVLCQGEMTLAFAVAEILITEYDMIVIAACSERIVTETIGATGKTIKNAEFRFVRFREYFQPNRENIRCPNAKSTLKLKVAYSV